MTEKCLLSISRTIYDPSTKDFVTASPDAKALPHIKEWINDHNPVIYWYILRIDNPTENDISQWAVELYAHQALTITEAYIDGSDRKFELRKERHDPWTQKCVLSVSRQIGIPIVSKGTRRIFFKVDIDCKEGLMHEYGISGAFMANGMDTADIKEKMFQYSCKVGEFKQIFDKDPHEASHYAEKRLVGKYSSNSVQVFTNCFRMIHELYGYCHSGSLHRDDLLQKLHLLYASFEGVPEIAGKRISPLINDGICELDIIVDRDKFAPRFIKLCDALVELLHIEVMGAEMKEEVVQMPPPEPVWMGGAVNGFNVDGQKDCPACGNVIDSSNKVLICMECGTRFCNTCEGWFREEERTRGQKPLCKDCFGAEQNRLREAAEREVQLERERKEKEKQRKEKAEKNAREEVERKKREEEERLRREQEKKENEHKAKEDREEKKRQEERKKREAAVRKEKEKLEKQRKEKAEKNAREEAERKKREEEERLRREQEKKENERKARDIWDNSTKMIKIRTAHFEKGGFLGLGVKKEEIENEIEVRNNSIGMKFTHVSDGEFMMGSNVFDRSKPIHKVTINKSFYLGTYPVTQREWKAVMGNNPFDFKGDDLPVEYVSWNDAQEFIRKLNEKEGTNKYRLPSEAEWEYSCRAGTTSKYCFGDSESKLGEYAWYGDNSGRKTHLVGKKKPNDWGLYDMHGNVWEWVQDKYHDNYEGAPTDGSAWKGGGGSSRVLRGGGWLSNAWYCRSADRYGNDPGDRFGNLGFRLLQKP